MSKVEEKPVLIASAKSLKKVGKTKVDTQKVAEEIYKALAAVESDHSTVIADKIKKATQNVNQRIEIINKLIGLLENDESYGADSIKEVVADVKKQLGIPEEGKAPAAVTPTPKVEVESVSSGEMTAEITKAVKTGAYGNDGSPAVKITVKIANLPKETKSLGAFVTTNQDWPFGAAQTGGKTSGDFTFTGYCYYGNLGVDNKLSIKIYGEKGKELGRIPADNYEWIKFVPITLGIE